MFDDDASGLFMWPDEIDALSVRDVADWDVNWRVLTARLSQTRYLRSESVMIPWSEGLSRTTSRVHHHVLWIPRHDLVIAPDAIDDRTLCDFMHEGVRIYTGSPL